MRVDKIITKENKERYVLIDGVNNEIVIPVAKFLKLKDQTGSARNTLRTYCYHLKLFYDFLEQLNKTFDEIQFKDLGKFIEWLKGMNVQGKVSGLTKETQSKRTNRTINQVMNTVLTFYDYLSKSEEYENTLNDKLHKAITTRTKDFKGFLSHLDTKERKIPSSVIKLKEPKKRIKVLNKEDVQRVIDSCNNIRDRFLIMFLYETGCRIGEALSLQIEDINFGARKVNIKERSDLENGAEIKTINSARVLDVTSELMNLYSDYILEIHNDDEIDTNFVFVNLIGKNKGKPMNYSTVNALFKNLKNKTGVEFTPHVLRHTNLTELWRTGEMRPEILQKRAGHANVQTTLDMYVHINEDDVRKEWEKASKKKGVN